MLWLGLALAAYLLSVLFFWAFPRSLAHSPYPAPEVAEAEIEALAKAHPELCQLEKIGESRQGRPIHALRLRGRGLEQDRPRLLVTAQIHAVEFIGSFVVRAASRKLAERYGQDASITQLLDRADVWVVPLLNPDGARRVFERRGRSGLGWARFTAAGVDPNRNFPFVPHDGKRVWTSGKDRPGSPFYRGPKPLSEPECMSLARLTARERFCAAIHFHSFGCVVFLPELPERDRPKLARAFDTFRGAFQSHQRHRSYKPVEEKLATISGQLDPFLLHAFGTVSVTVEVGKPSWSMLRPWRTTNVFALFNPPDPQRWAENDVDATIHALVELLERTEGKPATPAHPELVAEVPS